jgi:2-(1,2-epoxy-1,2-dihydrophenyl)acetyl-CoA isomerase
LESEVSDEVLKYTIKDSVAEVILHRPKQYNSFNNKLRKDLPELLDSFETSLDVRVVLICGSGPGFTAGADLNEIFPPPISEHLQTEYKPIFDKIVSSRLLYVASVHGSAAGIGAALAMACDLLIMSETAKISLIFSNIGLVPDGGTTWFLQHALGYRKALQLIVEGGHIKAGECLKYGLANKVVSDDELKSESRRWAKELSERAPLATAASKRLLRKTFNSSYEQAFISEALEQDKVSISEDFANAREAFFKKVKPVFQGK